MNKKPILIITGVLALALCVFLFVRSKYLAKPEKKEVIVFLDHFNADLKQGFADTLLNYFDGKQNSKQLVKLLGALSNKTSLNGKDKALFDVNLLSGDSEIKVINTELIEATVPVVFNENGNNTKTTSLIIKLRKISSAQFKIMQIDARQFVNDFMAYENSIKNRNQSAQIVYSPITLESFKIAEQLKSKYDSVIWFTHIDKATYFYVVKGKWDESTNLDFDRRQNNKVYEPYKMGLVDPKLKEIIPLEYDLVYAIGGSFPNMIEVEKDKKRGFYAIDGKLIVPVKYDQIFPIDDDMNLAVLVNGNEYFYLKKDLSISEKVDLKVSNFFAKIKKITSSFSIGSNLPFIMEYNSREEHGAVYIAPSYLTDLNLIDKIKTFKNPLRKVQYEEVSKSYDIKFSDTQVSNSDNWLSASFYSIRDYFLGGRTEFYDKQNIVIVDKKRDKIFAHQIISDFSEEESDGSYTGSCNLNSIKALNDSLFEIKAGAGLYRDLYDSTKTLAGGTYYHYLTIKNNVLEELPNKRIFSFTKYIKMDDSYLSGCYEIQTGDWSKHNVKTIDHITPAMLQYMKNEIYADYRYAFKDKRWKSVFANMTGDFGGDTQKPGNASVDDSLTVIDKYNINFINQKLKVQKPQRLAALK
ncbi:MAG: YARHG domain-containing protein [Mucilaginibacter sp.]|uniref:WG repeat-containing protein n=1 Tax=Mucilaginibacter sp. TaxID=1882438 RepID=UPI003264F2EB